MQNILQQQDDLKNFSQQQLIMEMQRPSGNVPQFLVLSELTRRKRMQEDLARAEAANAPTVAEEVVMAAGMGDMSQMAQAMAPKTSMTENTGIAAMMPKQPTRMATGGVVKMQTAGSPTREVVLGGKRYITDGSGRVFEAARRGSMRRGREVTDPDIVSAVLATGPSVASDVGGLGDVSTNLDTLNPIASQGITPVDTFDSDTDPLTNFMGGKALSAFKRRYQALKEEMPTTSEGIPTTDVDSANMSSVLNMTRGVPAMRDPAVIDPTTGQPYDAIGLMRQQAEQARQANAQAAFDRSLPTPDELMVPFNNTRNLFDPQGLNQQRAERDRILANEIAARGREDELSTFPVRNVFQDNQPQDSFDAAIGEIAGIGSTNFKTATALEAENQNREDSLSTFPIRNVFQDNQPQVGDIDPRSIYNLGPGSTAAAGSRGGGSGPVDILPVESNPLLQGGNISTPMPFTQYGGLFYSDDLLPPKLDEEKSTSKQPTFLDNQPQTKEDIIEGETAAVINSAANTLANDVGGDALGARGPEVAKAAQQGFDKRMWMNIAMFGLIASEGTAKSRTDAAKQFLKMSAQDKALETKERISKEDRASREKVAGIRAEATRANTEARIRSAALSRDFRVLESIQDELKEDIAALMPLNPKEPISAQNKDAYNTLTQQLKKTRELIKNLGTFDLGPGSGQTEIAGSYNVTAGAS